MAGRRAIGVVAVAVAGLGCGGPGSRGAGGATVAPPDEAGLIPLALPAPSWEVFPNPERGFYKSADLLAEPDLGFARAAGSTLVHAPIRLDGFRDGPLSSGFLASLDAAFGRVRAAGLKVIPRFMYNVGPYPAAEPDASEARIAEHIGQLRPVLAANADVIVALQAGFIGAWGEWHTSTHGLDRDPAAKRRVVAALLAALPADRMIQLRFPLDLEAIVAGSGAAGARLGNHQDCFLGSDSDVGTWGRTGADVEEDKARIAELGRRAVIGGETCAPSPRSTCWFASEEARRMHFSYLNADFHPEVIERFRREGCFLDFEIRLGYRLVARAAAYRVDDDGRRLRLVATIGNVGYAAPFNPRPAYLVLERVDGEGRRIELPLAMDVRAFASLADHAVSERVALPADLAPGTYRMSLWLPDPAPRLRDRPEYAVRLANVGAWDPTSGLNRLADDVVLGGGAVHALSIEDFGGPWPSGNDLGSWTSATGFASGGGAGERAGGVLALAYDGGGWLGTGIGRDVSGYRYLVLRVRGAAGGEERDVRMNFGAARGRLAELTADRITTAWSDVTIDLSRHPPGSMPQKLELGFAGKGRVEIDGIQLRGAR